MPDNSEPIFERRFNDKLQKTLCNACTLHASADQPAALEISCKHRMTNDPNMQAAGCTASHHHWKCESLTGTLSTPCDRPWAHASRLATEAEFDLSHLASKWWFRHIANIHLLLCDRICPVAIDKWLFKPMLSLSFEHSDAKYQHVPKEELAANSYEEKSRSWRGVTQLAILFVVAILLSFFIGRHSLSMTDGGLLGKHW